MIQNNLEDQMKAIDSMLDVVVASGMEVEVIYWALRYMKENPSAEPAEAFIMGVTEWIK